MKIAIVMLHYGKVTTTENALRRLKAKATADTSLYLINNTQDDLSRIKDLFPHTTIINNQTNLGFAKGVNQGIKRAITAKSDAIMLMNNDLFIKAGSIDRLASLLSARSDLGIISPLLHHSLGYDWGGKYSAWSGMVKHINWPNPPKTTQSVDHVAAAAIMFTPSLIEKVGYFDERFFLYYEDLDFCLRVRAAGYQIQITPQVIAEHATSSGSTSIWRVLYQWRSHAQFVSKHLFKEAHITAYFYTLIIYPLYLIKALIKK